MTIRISGDFSHNGLSGIRIDGNPDAVITNAVAVGNGRHGIEINTFAPEMQSLGLAENADPKDVAAFLLALQKLNSETRGSELKNPEFTSGIRRWIVDASTFANNCLEISSSPMLAALINKLSSS